MYSGNGYYDFCGMDEVLMASCKCITYCCIFHINKYLYKKEEDKKRKDWIM